MNVLDVLLAIKEDEKALEVFGDILVNLLQEHNGFRSEIIAFLQNDAGFSLFCEEISDYYYSGRRISLSVDGSTVCSDSFNLGKY